MNERHAPKEEDKEDEGKKNLLVHHHRHGAARCQLLDAVKGHAVRATARAKEGRICGKGKSYETQGTGRRHRASNRKEKKRNSILS